MLNKNKILFAVALLAVSFSSSFGQTKKDLETQLGAYFEERLHNVNEETHLYPFQGSYKLKAGEVEVNRKLVWDIWKNNLLRIDSLPMLEAVMPGNAKYAVQQWELKKEDPLPFCFIKKDDNKGEQHALFLNLHGSGPKQTEFNNTIGWSVRFEDKPSIYFIPQIPNERRYRWWYKPVQYAWERLFRLANVSEVINKDKIYVMGISEGGYGSQRLGAFYADYLAGAGPMAGGEPLKNAPALNFRNIAFSLETGVNDQGFGRNKLTAIAKEEFGKLAQENPSSFVHKINLQPDKGHWIDYTVTTPWLINYVRNTRPKHISWVLFPMDGRYRKGFYNVALNGDLPIKEGDEYDRISFDIQFKGNNIYVKADLMNNEMTATKAIEKLDFSLFLDDKYVDYNQKVKVYLNGKLVYNKKLSLDLSNLVESCAMFADSSRIFPAKIRIVV